MKAGTQNHLKVKRLKRLLSIPLYRAVGILESLWLLCVDCCDEGNIGKFTDDEIADYLEWDGSSSELVRALADSGWTDVDPVHRYVVHDWLEHCPTYISDRVRKRNARKVKANEITTYVVSPTDNVGQTGGLSQACPVLSENVPSIPIPSQPILSHPNPSQPPAADAAPAIAGGRKPREKRHRFAVEQVTIPPALDTDEVRAALSEWLEYKQARGEGYKKPQYIEKALEFYVTPGPDAFVNAVNNSIGSNYSGLVGEKQNGKRTASKSTAAGKPVEPGTEHSYTVGW